MKLQKFLNEYEWDYASAYAREKKNRTEPLKGKTVVIAGDGESTLVRGIVYSFLAVNELRDTGMKVVFLPYERGKDSLYEELEKGREDFSKSSLEELKEADYLICAGYCCSPLPDKGPSDLHRQISAVFQKSAELLGLCKFLFLSDYRVFGNAEIPMTMYEYEMGRVDFADARAMEQMQMQMLETLCSCYMKQNEILYSILRMPMVYGPRIQVCDNPAYQAAKMTAEGETGALAAGRMYSFLYVSDMMRSIFYGLLLEGDRGKVFHVPCFQEAVTGEELVCLMHKAFRGQCRISGVCSGAEKEGHEERYGLSMGGTKLENCGFHSKVSLEDGMILLTRSLMKEERTGILDHAYHGKLKAVQEILLAYLLEVDRICRKYKIRYFLAGGTLLGAVRHHGFIPWDDDADIMMLREDYDRFLEVAQQELPQGVFLQTEKTDPEHHQPFTKIRMDNTLFATEFSSRFKKMHNGIFVDVLAHDKTADSRLGQKVHLFTTLLTRSMVFNKWKGAAVPGNVILSAAATAVKHILPMRTLEWIMKKNFLWFQNSRSRYLYDGMGMNVRRGAFPKKWLDETVELEFEGYKFPVPKEYDAYLTWLYGDYMQMIPVSERRTSHAMVLTDLGEYLNFHNLEG